MALVHRVFFMKFHSSTGIVEYFLVKSDRIFLIINLLDIAGHPVLATSDLVPVAPAAASQLLPLAEFPLVSFPFIHPN